MSSDVSEPEKVEPEKVEAADVRSDSAAEESTAPATDSPLTPSIPGPLQPAAAVDETEQETAGYGAVGEAEQARLDELRTALMEHEVKLHEATTTAGNLRRERGRLLAREERARSGLDSIEERQARLAEAHNSLREWAGVRSPSFAWNLLERLAGERSTAARELRMLRDATATPLGNELPTPAQLQNNFMKKVTAGFGVAAVLLTLVLALKRYMPGLDTVQSPANPFSWPVWITVLVALGAFIVWWCVCVVNFYRENSRRRQALRYASSYVDYLSSVGLTVRQEMQRLNALHDQVPEYLRYLSEVLHRPWAQPAVAYGIDPDSDDYIPESPESLVFDTRRPDAEYLPSFMRLAECPPGAGSGAEATLVRETVRSLVHRGWRFGALTGLLHAVEQAESMPTDSFAPARLDRDPRLRSALLQSLDVSEARRLAGRDRLRSIARQVQLSVMDEHHPPVSDIARDPLAALRLDDDLLGGSDFRLKEWDDFLGETLHEGSGWGAPAFSLDGRAAIPAVSSRAYGPERLEDSHALSVAYTPLVEGNLRPIELVVRVDRTVTGLGPTHFLVFDGAPPGSGQGQTPMGTDLQWTPGAEVTAPLTERGLAHGESLA